MQLNGTTDQIGIRRFGADGAAAALAHIGAALRSARGALLWLVFALSLAVFIVAAVQLYMRDRTNTLIRELRAGKDVEVDIATATPALLEARADFLLTRDRIADAQPLLDQAGLRASSAGKARLLFNMANARVRAALHAIEQGQFDKAIPLVSLAKTEYRSVLRLEPRNWDAKYNLDVAMRLVRDLPRGEGENDEDSTKTPAKLWTDLPGVPKGLP
jgi:mxaK protein